MGWQLLHECRYEDAITQLKRLLSAEPNYPWAHWGLCSGFYRTGKYKQAVAEAQQYLVMTGHGEAAEAMQDGQAEPGYQESIRRAADNLVVQANSRYVQAILIARLYALAQQKNLALDWLEKSCELGEPWFTLIDVDVDWNDLRDDPRFTKLLTRTGLDK